MTILTGQFPQNTYGDLLTTTNAGQGLSNVLQPLQDGLGNSSAIQISQQATQFSNIMAIPTWTTGTRPPNPLPGAMGVALDTRAIEVWSGGTWFTFVNARSQLIANSWCYMNPNGTRTGSTNIAQMALNNATYTATFANPITNANYAIVHALSFTPGNNVVRQFTVTDQQPGQFSFQVVDLTGAAQVDTYVYFAVFGFPA